MIREKDEPVIDEIRVIRQEISARFEHDPSKLVAYYMELQKQHQGRLIDGPRTLRHGDESVA